MCPFLGCLNVAFSPNVIRPISNETCLVSQSSAHCCKAILPFSAPPRPTLDQFHRIVVSREPKADLAAHALVPLDTSSMTLNLLIMIRFDCASAHHGVILPTLVAFRLVAPCEKVFFEPFQKSFKLGDLWAQGLYRVRDYREDYGLE